jgi:hypothetical protein
VVRLKPDATKSDPHAKSEAGSRPLGAAAVRLKPDAANERVAAAPERQPGLEAREAALLSDVPPPAHDEVEHSLAIVGDGG